MTLPDLDPLSLADHPDRALLSLAWRMADAARAASLPWFRRAAGLDIDNKQAGGFDPVTEADRATEAAMRALLASERPDDAILGEEGGHSHGRSGIEWVLDPIDGTRAFISGVPSWGVLIAANRGAVPFLGIIDQPHQQERFWALDGRSFITDRAGTRALTTRACPTLATATLFTTFPEVGTAAEKAGFDAVRAQVRLTRYGLDCYAYALLAMGTIDLVIEAGLQPYDVQALIPVITGAGGVITDWQGNPCHQGGRVLAAGSRMLHAQALALLRGY